MITQGYMLATADTSAAMSLRMYLCQHQAGNLCTILTHAAKLASFWAQRKSDPFCSWLFPTHMHGWVF